MNAGIYKAKQVASLLGVSVWTVVAWTRSGKLKAIDRMVIPVQYRYEDFKHLMHPESRALMEKDEVDTSRR